MPAISSNVKKECYIIGQEASRFHVNMTESRLNAASIVVGNRLWVLGGCCSMYSSRTSEYVSIIDGIGSEVGPDMPIPLDILAVVSLNETTAMLFSGAQFFNPYKTFYYSYLTQHWTLGPNMIENLFQGYERIKGFHINAGIITDQITLEDHVVVFRKDQNNSLTIQILENNQWYKAGVIIGAGKSSRKEYLQILCLLVYMILKFRHTHTGLNATREIMST